VSAFQHTELDTNDPRKRTNNINIKTLIGASFVLFSMASNAAEVTWVLNDVTFASA